MSKDYPTKGDLEQAGVKYLAASFVDMHGVSKAKMVPIHHYERMMEGSELFTGAALDGVPQEVSDEEVAAVPDPASAKILPWDPEVAWFASDLRCQGRPFEAGSRNILKRVLAKAGEKGLGMNLGMEAEFFVFEDTEDGGFAPVSKRPQLDKPCYDLVRLLDNKPWLRDLVEAVEELDWGLYSFDHEDGVAQVELDFRYFPVLEMADNFVFLRMMAGEIARRHGYFASFMPKPLSERSGCGAHYNMSLYDLHSGDNLFATDHDPRGNNLSKLGYQFIAGVLKHLPAICAVVAPTVNSYKRLVKQGSMSGFTWAPIFCCYGDNNRTNTLRIPLEGKRVELRAADGACNPYLGGAMVLAAGLEGIAQALDPGEPHTENMYIKTEAELEAMGIETLPKTLEEALDAFEADPLSKEVFGDAMFSSWLDFKRQEWLAYINHVSDWEQERYLKFF
ncbi:MAG: type III glutamate--ammonia ligase [Methyloligella sp. ZOD6]